MREKVWVHMTLLAVRRKSSSLSARFPGVDYSCFIHVACIMQDIAAPRTLRQLGRVNE